MCLSCYCTTWSDEPEPDSGPWIPDDRDETQMLLDRGWVFARALDDERFGLMVDCYDKLRLAEDAPNWMGGPLHVQVDDDNYDLDYEERPEWLASENEWRARSGQGPVPQDQIEARNAAGAAWNLLVEKERAIVVAWRSRYDDRLYGLHGAPAKPER